MFVSIEFEHLGETRKGLIHITNLKYETEQDILMMFNEHTISVCFHTSENQVSLKELAYENVGYFYTENIFKSKEVIHFKVEKFKVEKDLKYLSLMSLGEPRSSNRRVLPIGYVSSWGNDLFYAVSSDKEYNCKECCFSFNSWPCKKLSCADRVFKLYFS